MSDPVVPGLNQLLAEGPVAVNLGLREFAESLQIQGVDVVHVEWSPPAEGDEQMGELLDQLI